jgi:hypothetical protein
VIRHNIDAADVEAIRSLAGDCREGGSVRLYS